MARCRCEGSICTCVLLAGDGVQIQGTGAAGVPWVISAPTRSTDSVDVDDTTTLDLTRVGNGTEADPYVISGAAIIGALVDFLDTSSIDATVTGAGSLADPLQVTLRHKCLDCGLPGNPGDVLTLQLDGTYKPGPPTTAAPGAISTGFGITGNGQVGTPLRVDLCTYADLKTACVP